MRAVREDSSTERDSDEVIETPASTIKNKETDSAEESEGEEHLVCRDNTGKVHRLRTYRTDNAEYVKRIGISKKEDIKEIQDLSYVKKLRFYEKNTVAFTAEDLYNDWRHEQPIKATFAQFKD
jgi:hypothetical protein